MAEGLVCVICGEQTPGYLLLAGLCPGCCLDTWIPPAYWIREKYAYDAIWRQTNATKHPPTGVAFLDDTRPRLSEKMGTE